MASVRKKLTRSKSAPNLKLNTPNPPPNAPNTLRKKLSQPFVSLRIHHQKRRDERLIQQLIDDSPINATEREALLQEQTLMAAITTREQTVNRGRRERLRRMKKCYEALHRQDMSLSYAISILNAEPPEILEAVRRYVRKVVEGGGASTVDVFIGDRRHEKVITSILEVLGVDWARAKSTDIFRDPWGDQGTERKEWEIRRVCGMVWYALKVIDGEIDEYAETIPDYALRMSQNEVYSNMRIMLPYLNGYHELRDDVRKYLNQFFDKRMWTRLAPLLWVVEPSLVIGTEKIKRGHWEDHGYRPKIIMIEVGQAQFAIYRFFPFHNDAYVVFLKSIKSLGTFKPTRISEDVWREFFLVAGAASFEQRYEVSEKVNDFVGEIQSGNLSGEVRFMYACMEVGVEMAYVTKESGFMALSQEVDRLHRKTPISPSLDPAVDGTRPVNEETMTVNQWNYERERQMGRSIWSHYGVRVFDVMYEPKPHKLDFLDTKHGTDWSSFGYKVPGPKEIKRSTVEHVYSPVRYTRARLIPLPPQIKYDFLAAVEVERAIVGRSLYGSPHGQPTKALKKRGKEWYGSWKMGKRLWSRQGRIELTPFEKMRIKKVEVLGIEKEAWDNVLKKDWIRRVFE